MTHSHSCCAAAMELECLAALVTVAAVALLYAIVDMSCPMPHALLIASVWLAHSMCRPPPRPGLLCRVLEEVVGGRRMGIPSTMPTALLPGPGMWPTVFARQQPFLLIVHGYSGSGPGCVLRAALAERMMAHTLWV